MKTYLSLITDNSGSMRHLAHVAMQDFNEQLATIQGAAKNTNQDIIASHLTIGVGHRAIVGREIVNSNVQVLKPLTHYPADACGTPMIDAAFEAIKLMESVPDANDPEVSFLLMLTTDGQETESRSRGRELAAKMKQLIATDRWTFVFRVPAKSGPRELATLGLAIPGINVYEWELSQKGVVQSTQANVEAFTEYFTGRTQGMKSTTKFYANLQDVSFEDLQKQLVDISSEVQFFDVTSADDQSMIRPFVEKTIGQPMARGAAFYQLNRTEPKVQANKRIAIRDKTTGTVFAGDAARQMLALPTIGTVRLAPDELGDYAVFIQSTSVNRTLDAGTQLMYWPDVGVAFKEGPSAK
ncbi:hypothetical protein [Acinetobacter sp.]|uniref:hypothetical protein n=1 Tax=Acinetobacter sp. TaxID=472 RepID=UPI00388F34A7